VCGKVFQPQRRAQRFCATRCRVQGYARSQQREALEGAEAARKLAGLLERLAARWARLAEGRRSR